MLTQHGPPSPAHPARFPRRRPHRQPARRGRGAAPHAQRRQPADARARGDSWASSCSTAADGASCSTRPARRCCRRGARARPDRRRRARRGRSRLGRRRRSAARDRCCRRSRSAGCCRAWATGTSKHPDIALELEASQQVVDLQREGFHAALRQGSGQWRGLHAELLIDSPQDRRSARRQAAQRLLGARRRGAGARAAARRRRPYGSTGSPCPG